MAEPRMVKCGGCGAPNSMGRTTCYSCGHSLLAAPSSPQAQSQAVVVATRAPAVPAHNPTTLACPCCTNIGVQKVSAIVRSGTWSGSSTGVSLAYGSTSDGHSASAIGNSFTQSSGATGLASALAPPPRPTVGGTAWVGTVLQVFGVLSSVAGLAVIATGLSVQGGLFLILGLACLYRGWTVSQSMLEAVRSPAYGAQLAQWERMMQRWDQLYYCAKCDTVSNPYTAEAAPVSRMTVLLVG